MRAYTLGFESPPISRSANGDPVEIDFVLNPINLGIQQMPGFAYLNVLPSGEEKRRLILDCAGCHAFNEKTLLDKEGALLDEDSYKASVDKMLSFSGAASMFPIMSPSRQSAPTAKFLSAHLTEEPLQAEAEKSRGLRAPAGGYSVTEYDLPIQQDFPHDLMLDGRGRIIITGMFTNLMYVLDPETAAFTTMPIPAPGGNPRALDLDAKGNWWILGGTTETISRYRVADEEWDHFNIGMYPHSIMLDTLNRVWFNGHFTHAPIKMGYVDSNSGEVVILEVPADGLKEENGSPIPYGLRVGPDGNVWCTELAGNRLVRLLPGSGEFKTYMMPIPDSGPRRLDVGADGVVWIPEFSGGKLARFDPEGEKFLEYDFPTSNSLPYCARIDHKRDRVWISQCANDAIALFDIKTEKITEYRLPTHIAFVRHLDIDPETGDVWAAYSHLPGIHPKIARLRVEGP
jgi:virginiamycin B lyase